MPNGITKAWLDGKLVLDKRDITFRYDARDEYTITRAYFTTYVGGSSVADFAPKKDQWIKCVPPPNHILVNAQYEMQLVYW